MQHFDHHNPDVWSDSTQYSPDDASPGNFWAGTENRYARGPLRGWWIRRLWIAAKAHAPNAVEDVWGRMVQWLVEAGDPCGYITFATAGTYQPGGPPGHWQLDKGSLGRDLPKAHAWALVAVEGPEDLEAILTEPLRRLAVAPKEASGASLIPDNQRIEFWNRRDQVQRHWPKACRDCHAEFRPNTRTAVRCDSCRGARRGARKAAKDV